MQKITPLYIPSNNPVCYTKTVEIKFNVDANTGAKFSFPLDNELNQKIITGLEIFSSTDITNAPSGNAVTSLAELAEILVTLKDGSDVKIDAIPARDFVRGQNAGIRYEIKNLRFNMQTSFIRTTNNNIGAGTSFFCAFTYIK